jgi:predicted PurR-regulated permease PerM
VLLSAYLLWKLRSLIVPVTVGGMVAYICRPLIAHFERYRIPRALAMALLLILFVLGGVFFAARMSAVAPSEIKLIELKIHALYKLNEGYNRLMGLDPSLTKGNRFYRLSNEELDPIIGRINRFLALSREEKSQFLASRPLNPHGAKGSDRFIDYHRANLRTLKVRAPVALSSSEGVSWDIPDASSRALTPDLKTPLSTVGHILSVWFIAPLIFLYLLRDTGEIKRGLLTVVPNRLFEPVLKILEDLNRAVGAYVRGIFLESVLLGLTITFLLLIVGVTFRWAIGIGMFSAATNVIPYLGSAAALLGGLAYALLVEEIHPLLPMVNTENFFFWVIAAVVVAELLKNIFYEPLVLGGAVKLHPLVVVIGVVAGGLLFDFAGLLLAIPVITVFKVLASSTFRQLRAYGLI